MNLSKKIIFLIVLFSFAGGTLFYPLKARAQANLLAQCAQEIFGIRIPSLGGLTGRVTGSLGASEVPVKDKTVKERIEQGEQKKCVDRLADLATTVARNALKKRILDTIVDQTIAWIQGGGEPKFVTDFGGFLEEAGQAAIGDVAQEVGLGDLCTGISPLRIRFQLETPVFSQRVSCTLDDIVGNIENFRESFSNGRWVGYQELLKPQNNRYGAEILVQAEAQRRISRDQEAKRQEVLSGGGFLSTKQCLEWEARGTDDGGKTVSQFYPYNSDSFIESYPDPQKPPPVLVTGINNLKWVCAKLKVSTPGQLIAGTTQRAINAHTDYVINADDLSEYAAAIIDAGINRLIKEGVRGLTNITTEESGQGFSNENDLPTRVRDPGGTYTESTDNQRSGQTRAGILNNLNNALTLLEQARSDYGNTRTRLDELAAAHSSFKTWCDGSTVVSPFVTTPNRVLHPQTCANYTEETQSAINGRVISTKTQIEVGLGRIDPLLNQVSGLISQVQNLTTTNVGALATTATNLLSEVTLVVDEAATLFESTQNELSATQTTLSNCQNPALASISCP